LVLLCPSEECLSILCLAKLHSSLQGQKMFASEAQITFYPERTG
jgi:hypothetical protein